MIKITRHLGVLKKKRLYKVVFKSSCIQKERQTDRQRKRERDRTFIEPIGPIPAQGARCTES